MTDLYSIIFNNLINNIVICNNKKYIVAGSTHLRSIWIRDTCYCIDTLHNMGMDEILDNTVILYMKSLVKDKNNKLYGPKCFDSMNPEWRTVKSLIKYSLGFSRTNDPINDIKPYLYRDSRQSIAIDSNVMICMAALTTGIYKKYIPQIIKC